LYTTQDGIYSCVTAGSWSSKYSIVTLLWKCFIMWQWKWNKSRNQPNQGFVTSAFDIYWLQTKPCKQSLWWWWTDCICAARQCCKTWQCSSNN